MRVARAGWPLALALALAAPAAAAQNAPGPFRIVGAPAPGERDAIPLRPDGAPAPVRARERWNRTVGDVGQIHVDQRLVRNVVRPTITPVPPAPARATGAAAIVAPGGAFLSLSMDDEGFDVARRLAERGVAAFMLKYRLAETPADDAAFMAEVASAFGEAGRGDARGRPTPPQSVADALEALKLVRARAARFRVDPRLVGMIGFSAGAQASMAAALSAAPAAEPAFLGYIYGPTRAVPVPDDAPPLFVALAMDDGLFGRRGFGLVEARRRADRPVELHACERGDHGFGAGRPGTTSTGVIDQFTAWTAARGPLAR